MIGLILGEKYKVEKKIGEGGFSTVYRALDLKLKRSVALKVLRIVGGDESFKKRFLENDVTDYPSSFTEWQRLLNQTFIKAN